MSGQYLSNHLLIAMPQMQDPNFAKTVTLICEHNQEGALGIVINRPLSISMGKILEQLDLDYPGPKANEPVLMGGPVANDRGFIVHQIADAAKQAPKQWESSLTVSDTIRVTTSKDILSAIAAGLGPKVLEFALGYSGWEAGQLEEELRANAWLTVACDARILFDTPYDQRWQAAAQLIGLDLNQLSGDFGHA